MICSKCGKEAPGIAKFCPTCGSLLEKKAFCMNCGKELREDQKFCSACGTPMIRSAPQSSVTASGTNNTNESAGNLIKKFACSFAVGPTLSQINNVSGIGYIYDDRIEFHMPLMEPDIFLIKDIVMALGFLEIRKTL